MNKELTVLVLCYCLFLSAIPLQAQREEIKKVEQDAADNKAHDHRSDNTNMSYCGSLSQVTKEKYLNGKQYYQTFKKQLLEQVTKERKQLVEESSLSNSLESKIDKKSGGQFSQERQEQAKTEHPLEEQRGNILASEASMKASDRDNEIGAYAQSGCTYNEETKECTLTGPLYQSNERLQYLAKRGVQEAEKFAKLKIEQLQLTEMKNAHNSDYKLFEALLSNKDTPEARKALKSNLNLAAQTAAAAKYLSCHPIAQHDSKAYHLYRAASAVFLTALINDTTYYEDTASCRATEEFTEDSHNKQINTLEKVTNLHENLFANLCLRTEPEEKELQEKCQKHIQKIFGPNPQYLDMPRTRDNALKMFKAAHRAAVSELKSKWLLVKTANEQIEKGKERIKESQRKLMIAIALRVASKALGINYDDKAKACAARTVTCSQFSYLKSQALKWWKKVSDYYILEIYYLLQILRWKKFVKKWQKKLSEAKNHTHLACNQKEAEREAKQIKNLVEKSRQQLTEEIIKEKNKVLENIHHSLNQSKASLPSYTPLTLALYLLLPPAVYAAPPKTLTNKALGISYGTWSFQKFLLNRNQHWFLLAQDVNPHLTWVPDSELYGLAYLDENNISSYNIKNLEELLKPLLKSLTSRKNHLGTPVQAQGFPLPETRVLSTARTVNLIEGNLIDTKNMLKVAAKQLDTYINLLHTAKKRLPLGHKGLMESAQVPVTKKVHCAKGQGKNLKFDSTCQCQKNNSCSKFKVPQFGKTNEPNNEYQLVQGIAKNTLEGELESANVKASLLKKKNALYNTLSPRSSLSSSPIQKKTSGQKSQDMSNSLFSKNLGENSKKSISSKSAASGSHEIIHQGENELGSVSQKSSLSRRKNNISSTNTLTKKSETNKIFLPPLSHFQEESLKIRTPSEEKLLDTNNTQAEYYNKKSSGRTSNIFKIISQRYQKSAYPIFQKK